MRIHIVTPAPAPSTYGNRITATRWAGILQRLGHSVAVSQTYDGRACDLLIALHARRSYQAIKVFHRQHPWLPTVVALTGTDLYRDLKSDGRTQQALEMATSIVMLQPKAAEQLNPILRAKARVIYQSAERSRPTPDRSPARHTFDVCVVAHLRALKDPFRAALASRLLPLSSRIRVLQIGVAMTESMATRAQSEAGRNPRYRWLGGLTRSQVRKYVTRSQLLVLSSRMEGGANVLSEAIVAGVPVLASRIDGNVGILGDDYQGLFEVGNTRELARLMQRAETDSNFLNELRRRIERLAPLFNPKREERAWGELIREVQSSST